MATTVVRANANTYSTGTTGGVIPGDAATGHVIRYIDGFIDALEPTLTPFLTLFGVGEEIDQRKVEWGQSYQLPHVVGLNTTMNNSQTSMIVNSGEGSYLQQYMVLRIIDATNGDEIVWISVDPGSWGGADTPTIVRAQGGTSAVSHTAPLTVQVIGTAEPQNVDHAQGSYLYGDWQYNYFQRFGTKLQFDRAARYQPNWEKKGDQLTTRMTEKGQDLKIQLEKALIYGRRQAGTPDPSAKRPELMGGITQFLTTNVYNQSGAALTAAAIETATADVYNKVDYNMPTTLWGNMKTKLIIDRIIEPIRFTNMGPKDNEIDLTLQGIRLETGMFTFKINRYMPDGELWGIDASMGKVHPGKNLAWHTEKLPSSGDYDIMSVSGDYTFVLKAERKQFRIYGFDTTLSNYSMGV